MKQLSETWYAEGYIDFELKKYTLLAYLQQVNRYFDENKLYPQLSDIIFHYNNIVALRENKKHLQEQFPRQLNGIQLEKLQVLYERIIGDDEIMQELENIIQYSTQQMKTTIQSGADIYELHISPVGIIPLDNEEGYFFLSAGSQRKTRVYQYKLSFFESKDEKFRSIKTSFIDSPKKGITYSFENLKLDLIRSHRHIPNPAVYSIETELVFPVEETLLPVAKRSLVKFITKNVA
jgi:hypothetical protein